MRDRLLLRPLLKLLTLLGLRLHRLDLLLLTLFELRALLHLLLTLIDLWALLLELGALLHLLLTLVDLWALLVLGPLLDGLWPVEVAPGLVVVELCPRGLRGG